MSFPPARCPSWCEPLAVPGGSILLLSLVLSPLAPFAAYGGIYIAASLGWMWAVEGARPDRFDLLGMLLCLAGAGVILLAPRG